MPKHHQKVISAILATLVSLNPAHLFASGSYSLSLRGADNHTYSFFPSEAQENHNLNGPVLDALSKGKSPARACTSRLSQIDPERYKRLRNELPDTHSPNLNQARREVISSHNGDNALEAPPILEGLEECEKQKKLGCMKLFKESISNPEQMSYKSTCGPETVKKFAKLKRKNGPISLVAIEESVPYEESIETQVDKMEAIEDRYFEGLNEGSICENQAEMSMEIISAIDGNPHAALASVDTAELMVLLKEINPSAHKAISCLQEGSGVQLKGALGEKGKTIGTLTGIPYTAGYDKRAGDEAVVGAGLLAACLAGPIACVGAGAAVFAAFLTAISIDKAEQNEKKNREQNELNRAQLENHHQQNLKVNQQAVDNQEHQWKFNNGFESKYGLKEGCDGHGNCKMEDKSTVDDANENPSATTNRSQPDHHTDKKRTNDENMQLKIAHDLPWLKKRKPRSRNANFNFEQGTVEKVCEIIYAGAEQEDNKFSFEAKQTINLTQESIEELTKEKEPIDFTTDANIYGLGSEMCNILNTKQGA